MSYRCDEHHLEDVAVDDVLLGHLDRLLVHAVGHRAAHIGKHVVGLRWGDRHVRQGQRKIGHGALDPTDRRVVRPVELVAIHTEHRHALDQVHPLAPVVERGQRADHAHGRVGESAIVMGHVGQSLDLANDVVAEIAHHPALQRRQVGDDRGSIDVQQLVERGEHAAVERHRRRNLAEGRDQAVAELQRRHRIAPDEAVAAPAFAVLDRFEQEPRAGADQLGVGGDRGLEVGEHLGPHRHHRVLGCQGAELVAARMHGQLAHSPNRRKKHEYAPVWQAPLPSCSTRNSSTSASQS